MKLVQLLVVEGRGRDLWPADWGLLRWSWWSESMSSCLVSQHVLFVSQVFITLFILHGVWLVSFSQPLLLVFLLLQPLLPAQLLQRQPLQVCLSGKLLQSLHKWKLDPTTNLLYWTVFRSRSFSSSPSPSPAAPKTIKTKPEPPAVAAKGYLSSLCTYSGLDWDFFTNILLRKSFMSVLYLN